MILIGGATDPMLESTEGELAKLFRRIATVQRQAPVAGSVDELEWRGPADEVDVVGESIDGAGLVARAVKLAGTRRQ